MNATTPVTYTAPVLCDYGSLTDLTRMQSINGFTEDAGSKMLPFHHNAPSAPAGP